MVVSVHTYRNSITCRVTFDYTQFPCKSVAVALLEPLPPKWIAARIDHTDKSKDSVILVAVTSSRPTDAVRNTQYSGSFNWHSYHSISLNQIVVFHWKLCWFVLCCYVNVFDIQRTVHRDIFLWWKPTRCTISQIYLTKYSTYFGQVHCPSSGVCELCKFAIGICHASSVGVC